MIADQGHDADWFRDVLKDKGHALASLHGKSQGKAIRLDKPNSRRRNPIEIMFGSLNWRRIATRYDRRLNVLLSAIAATILLWP
jgi:transposase